MICLLGKNTRHCVPLHCFPFSFSTSKILCELLVGGILCLLGCSVSFYDRYCHFLKHCYNARVSTTKHQLVLLHFLFSWICYRLSWEWMSLILAISSKGSPLVAVSNRSKVTFTMRFWRIKRTVSSGFWLKKKNWIIEQNFLKIHFCVKQYSECFMGNG